MKFSVFENKLDRVKSVVSENKDVLENWFDFENWSEIEKEFDCENKSDSVKWFELENILDLEK